jgi:S1-C subfamily serine protease
MSTPLQSFLSISNGFADAAESAGSSIVLVDARHRMPASGIAYANDLVLTANHVVEREDNAKIITADGREIQATLAGRDPARDIALLRLKEALSGSAVPAKASARVGQIVLALARPDRDGVQASLGVISAIGGPVRTGQGGLLEKYLRTDTQPLPGFSGGALISGDGSLLGMNTSGLAMGTLITIPSEVLWNAAESLSKHGHIRRAYLGIRSQSVTLGEPQRKMLERDQETGLLLVGLEDNAPAAKSGLMVGDILVGLNGQPVRDHDELQAQMTPELIAAEVPVELIRGGQKTSVKVTLGEH